MLQLYESLTQMVLNRLTHIGLSMYLPSPPSAHCTVSISFSYSASSHRNISSCLHQHLLLHKLHPSINLSRLSTGDHLNLLRVSTADHLNLLCVSTVDHMNLLHVSKTDHLNLLRLSTEDHLSVSTAANHLTTKPSVLFWLENYQSVAQLDDLCIVVRIFVSLYPDNRETG